MYRIKRVAGILKRLAVVSLPPAVEPDGHEREQCKPLLADLKLQSEKLDRENLSSDERHIDPIERRDLPEQLPPLSAAEEIEHKHRQNAHAVIIYHAERAERKAQHRDRNASQKIEPCLPLFPHGLHRPNAEKADEQRPDDILVHRVEPRAAVHQVKGNFRQQRKNQHPLRVFFETVRVEVALHRHEGKNGERETSHAGHPLLRKKKRRPQVVEQHEGHR